MNSISRREFMAKAGTTVGASGLLAAFALEARANPLGLPIGSQTWPTRSMLKDFPAYVKMMAELGVTRLELCSPIGYGAEFASLANASEDKKIAAVAGKAGMQQGLHNEGFEVSRVDGKRTYDLLFDLLDPKLVKYQFQMSTITDGFVAADYFQKYPGRFFSMHLQDVDMTS